MNKKPEPTSLVNVVGTADALLARQDFAGTIAYLKPFAAEPQTAPPPILMKLAEAYMKSGHSEEALPLLGSAYRRQPQDPDCAFLLGRAFIDCDLFDRALPLLKQALQSRPESYAVHWALADYHTMCERADLAVPHFEKAIELAANPVQKAALRKMLGDAYQSIDQQQHALACFESITEPEPIRIGARLRSLEIITREPTDPSAQELMRIAETTTNPGHRMGALLALVKVHDKAKDFDRAFELARSARSGLAITTHNARVLEEENKFRRDLYARDLYAATAPLTSDDDHIVLIAGMPRSGTTLMEQVLAAHPSAAGFGETTRFIRLSQAFQDNVGKLPDPRAAIIASAKKGELMARAKDNLAFLRSISDKPWVRAVEKTPMNFEAMGYMHLIHPKARFIHCRRHPADSFLSSYQNPLSQYHDYAYSQETYAERFLAKEQLMAHWKSLFPEQIIEIDYEEFVGDPERHVRAVLDFAGLPWDDSCMRFFERSATVRTLSKEQVRKSFYQSSKSRWVNYRSHLNPLFSKLESVGFSYP